MDDDVSTLCYHRYYKVSIDIFTAILGQGFVSIYKSLTFSVLYMNSDKFGNPLKANQSMQVEKFHGAVPVSPDCQPFSVASLWLAGPPPPSSRDLSSPAPFVSQPEAHKIHRWCCEYR